MSNDNGGPAFPIPLNPGEHYESRGPADGMTLRDYFAAKAMQGLMASDVRDNPEAFAKYSYQTADAMLAEREKG